VRLDAAPGVAENAGMKPTLTIYMNDDGSISIREQGDATRWQKRHGRTVSVGVFDESAERYLSPMEHHIMPPDAPTIVDAPESP